MGHIHSEAELEKWLIGNTSRIEKGLEYIDRQVDLAGYGRLDLLCRDSEGRYVIVELKKSNEKIDERIVSQLLKYRMGLVETRKYRITDASKVRILCFVSHLDPNVRKICKHAGIGVATHDFSEIDFPEGTVGGSSEKIEKHGVFPIIEEFFSKLREYCF